MGAAPPPPRHVPLNPWFFSFFSFFQFFSVFFSFLLAFTFIIPLVLSEQPGTMIA